MTATTPVNTTPTSPNSVVWIGGLAAAIVAAVLILRIPSPAQPWPQGYDPLGHWWLSALVAALAGRRIARQFGSAAYESSFRGFARIGHFDRLRHFYFRHAREFSG